MQNKYVVQALTYKDLPQFLSEKQLAEHHDVLYAGYVKKVNEIREAQKTIDQSKANATWSDIREAKLEEGFAVNGVVLHEHYFNSMFDGGNANGGVIRTWIEEDFGSFMAWEQEFAALGMASRGWVVLAYDMNDGKLHNYICDSHNQGGIWGAVPLIVLDVYEHAFFIDYATAKKKYVDGFMASIDFSAAATQIAKYGLEKLRTDAKAA